MPFFRDMSLSPVPPVSPSQKEVRYYLDIREDDQLDEARVRRLGEASQPIARRTTVSVQYEARAWVSGRQAISPQVLD